MIHSARNEVRNEEGCGVDLIGVSGGSATVRAAKNATKTIPIVMIGWGDDPVEAPGPNEEVDIHPRIRLMNTLRLGEHQK